ncbi:hypothetical protein AHAS_Ahas17G0142500 [Arachis hypogaea]
MCIGDGCKTRFWEDTWVKNMCLKKKFSRLFAISSNKANIIANYGFWDGLSSGEGFLSGNINFVRNYIIFYRIFSWLQVCRMKQFGLFLRMVASQSSL